MIIFQTGLVTVAYVYFLVQGQVSAKILILLCKISSNPTQHKNNLTGLQCFE